MDKSTRELTLDQQLDLLIVSFYPDGVHYHENGFKIGLDESDFSKSLQDTYRKTNPNRRANSVISYDSILRGADLFCWEITYIEFI